MFGSREEFTYFECSACGCLQIAEIPEDMAKYYPSNYYSFHKRPPDNAMRRYARTSRNRCQVFGPTLVRKLLFKQNPDAVLRIVGDSEPDHDTSILDVGCGSAALLYILSDLGFRNLVGLDPYIGNDTVDGSVRVLGKSILDLSDGETFDLVLFNHSLEHIWYQAETLSKVHSLLTARGSCLVRMPVKTETIWHQYGTHWVSVDAPRHFYLHTMASFGLLCQRTGFTLKDVFFESTERQFWGSEQCRMGIPLEAEHSYQVNPKRSAFTASQIREFRRMARHLNMIKQGDQAAFFLAADTRSR